MWTHWLSYIKMGAVSVQLRTFAVMLQRLILLSMLGPRPESRSFDQDDVARVEDLRRSGRSPVCWPGNSRQRSVSNQSHTR